MGLRVVFAGTPTFAAQSLQALLGSEHQVVGVYTQPDRPAGRGRKPQASAVKQLALQAGLPVCQPASFKDPDTIAELHALKPDVMVVVVYGLLLPQAVLDVPQYGCLNIHPSLLPRWRGAAPIQHTILAGDSETAVSIMQLEAGLDTGPVVNQQRIALDGHETSASLYAQCAGLGAELLLQSLDQLAVGKLSATPQSAQGVTYADKIKKADAQIDWTQPAAQIERQIRAYNSKPIAYSLLGEVRVRVYAAEIVEASGEPGKILDQQGLVVACGRGGLRLLTIQLPGGKPVDAAAVQHGHPGLLAPGLRFSA